MSRLVLLKFQVVSQEAVFYLFEIRWIFEKNSFETIQNVNVVLEKDEFETVVLGKYKDHNKIIGDFYNENYSTLDHTYTAFRVQKPYILHYVTQILIFFDKIEKHYVYDFYIDYRIIN